MNTIRIEFNKKNIFTMDYDKTDEASTNKMVVAYWKFYQAFRDSRGGISARRWRFPEVFIDRVVKYVVTPNGRWEEKQQGLPILTQDEIDEIRRDLACIKEDKYDPENTPDAWDAFDALLVKDVYNEDMDYTHGFISECLKTRDGFTVGDLYEELTKMEERNKG